MASSKPPSQALPSGGVPVRIKTTPAPKKRATPKPKPAKKRAATPPPSRRRSFGRAVFALLVGVGLGLLLAGFVLFRNATADVRAWLQAPKPLPPTEIYSAPIALTVGEVYARNDFVADLLAAGLEQGALDRPGRFQVSGHSAHILPPARGAHSPAFTTTPVDVTWDDAGRITALTPSAAVLPPTRLALLGDLDSDRKGIPLDALPAELPSALLAIEDSRFWSHYGVDPVGIGRALWRNLRSSSTQGGSTLTQQLAKNVFLTRERTWKRKVKELFYAFALEVECDKRTLLTRYLNEVYLGHLGGRPIHGVEAASRAWFGHGASSLTLSESALIVGAIASPNVYAPTQGTTDALRRRHEVLERMVAIGAATAAQAKEADAQPITTAPQPLTASWRLPWAVDATLAELDELDLSASNGGLRVYTGILPQWQRAAQAAVGHTLAQMAEQHPDLHDAQAALVALDANRGLVRAIIGGRDYRESPFPRATRAKRQPGSTVKALTMLAAFARDPALSPASLLDDGPLTIRTDGRAWSPTNIDKRDLGQVTLRDAIATSRNLPAVRLAQKVGFTELQAFYQKAGLSDATHLPSAALGAFSATPWQLAGAYTVFPGAGTVVHPRMIERILDADGGVLLDVSPVHTQLTDAATAALASSVLERVVTHGTAHALKDAGITGALGGKTGTSDDARDAWFAGFDATRAFAIWVGRDQGAPLGLTGGKAAVPIFVAFAQTLGLPASQPLSREGLVAVDTCESTGIPSCGDCNALAQGWFRKTHAPDPASCRHTPQEPNNAEEPSLSTEDDEATPASPAQERRLRRAEARDKSKPRSPP